MADREPPSLELLRQLLRYEADTGQLFWLPRTQATVPPCNVYDAARMAATWNTRHAGKQAGSRDKQGYIRLMIWGRTIKAHRVIWAIDTGSWPLGEIDHINGDKADNRLSNLRSVTHQENSRNRSLRSDNRHGAAGLSLLPNGKWRASIKDEGRTIHLGVFRACSDAVAARMRAAAEFGYHANHGRVNGENSTGRPPQK